VSDNKAEVLSMLADGLSQREINRRTGISRKTLYRWAEDVPKPDAAPRRHFIIPDTQCKPGEPMDHLPWIGKAIRDYKPDLVVHIGDHFDFPSLSTHSAPESGAMEGLRYEDDLKAGNDGLRILHKAMGGWHGRKILLRGNHENRLTRYIDRNPKLAGAMGFHQFADKSLGWEVVDYYCGSPGQIVVDGVIYAHYFAAVNTGRAIGGTANNKLNHVGRSFVQGHVQGYEVGTKQYATGVVRKGIVAGSAYLHDEDYKGMANSHWRGVVVLNEVSDGQFCEMPLTLDYLCRKYEGMSVARYLREHYENAEQRFCLARSVA
jgi:hypothetical protein